MANNLPGEGFEAWEAEFAAQAVGEEMPPPFDAQTYKEHLLNRANDLSDHIIRRAANLGVYTTKQFHQLPLPDGKIRMMLGHEHPAAVRLTYNRIFDVKQQLYDVAVEDYRFKFSGGFGLSMQAGTRLIKSTPQPEDSNALPIIWRNIDGGMSVYSGVDYRVARPRSFSRLHNVALEYRLYQTERIIALLGMLSREVSLEEEYPYAD